MILSLLEHEAGVPTQLGVETLAFAAALAARTGDPLHVAAVGPAADKAVAAAGPGAEVAHLALTDLDAYAPRAWAHALQQVAEAGAAAAVVAPGSERGNEVMAYLAAMTDLPLATNCVEVDPGAGGVWRLSRSRWAGSLLEDAELDPGAAGAPRLLTVALGAQPPGPAPSPTEAAAVRAVATAADDADLRVRVDEVVAPGGDGVSLSDARVIVSGGRGVGGEEGFAVLEELAGLLDAAVGCSRVVTSEGWRPHRDQVGQTGTRVSPDLYIACGISGAIQHMVGCKGAKKILAINTDPEAPIMARADYSIVGDLHAVLPAVVAEIRRTREGRG